jgi:hypothetical protein
VFRQLVGIQAGGERQGPSHARSCRSIARRRPGSRAQVDHAAGCVIGACVATGMAWNCSVAARPRQPVSFSVWPRRTDAPARCRAAAGPPTCGC